MAHSIRPTDVGKRVTLQFFDEDGGRNEALGLLERVEMEGSEAILHVRKKDDTMVKVPLSRIRAGKVVVPRSQRS